MPTWIVVRDMSYVSTKNIDFSKGSTFFSLCLFCVFLDNKGCEELENRATSSLRLFWVWACFIISYAHADPRTCNNKQNHPTITTYLFQDFFLGSINLIIMMMNNNITIRQREEHRSLCCCCFLFSQQITHRLQSIISSNIFLPVKCFSTRTTFIFCKTSKAFFANRVPAG